MNYRKNLYLCPHNSYFYERKHTSGIHFLKDVSFVNLMTRRIFNVLIVANPYDAFMLEDDGRVDEKIFDEYMELGMRYPPTFTQVSTTEEASNVLTTMLLPLPATLSTWLLIFLVLC